MEQSQSHENPDGEGHLLGDADAPVGYESNDHEQPFGNVSVVDRLSSSLSTATFRSTQSNQSCANQLNQLPTHSRANQSLPSIMPPSLPSAAIERPVDTGLLTSNMMRGHLKGRFLNDPDFEMGFDDSLIGDFEGRFIISGTVMYDGTFNGLPKLVHEGQFVGTVNGQLNGNFTGEIQPVRDVYLFAGIFTGDFIGRIEGMLAGESNRTVVRGASGCRAIRRGLQPRSVQSYVKAEDDEDDKSKIKLVIPVIELDAEGSEGASDDANNVPLAAPSLSNGQPSDHQPTDRDDTLSDTTNREMPDPTIEDDSFEDLANRGQDDGNNDSGEYLYHEEDDLDNNVDESQAVLAGSEESSESENESTENEQNERAQSQRRKSPRIVELEKKRASKRARQEESSDEESSEESSDEESSEESSDEESSEESSDEESSEESSDEESSEESAPEEMALDEQLPADGRDNYPGRRTIFVKCFDCPKEFNTFAELVDHQTRVHQLGRYLCFVDDCVGSFTSSELLQSHIKAEHRNGTTTKYACRIQSCTTKIKNQDCGRIHFKTHIQGHFECTLCTCHCKMIDLATARDRFRHTQHNSTSCRVTAECGQKLLHPNALRHHRESFHQKFDYKTVLRCKSDNLCALSRYTMIKHLKAEHGFTDVPRSGKQAQIKALKKYTVTMTEDQVKLALADPFGPSTSGIQRTNHRSVVNQNHLSHDDDDDDDDDDEEYLHYRAGPSTSRHPSSHRQGNKSRSPKCVTKDLTRK